MASKVISEQVDIYQPPSIRHQTPHCTSITIGDLHANPIKLLFTLIREGACYLSANNYQNLVDIYLKSDRLFQTSHWEAPIKKHLLSIMNDYTNLIEKITVADQLVHIRLLGDELADRGCNDWFILVMLNHLRRKNLKLTSILSNHVAEFIEAVEHYTSRVQSNASNPLGSKQDFLYGTTIAPTGGLKQSLVHLSALLSNQCITFAQIYNLYHDVYTKILCLVDFELSKEGLYIFSHAPIGIKVIYQLASKMAIFAKDMHLKAVIQRINQYFSDEYLLGHHTISSLYLNNNALCKLIHFMLWNRNADPNDLLRPAFFQENALFWVHGHDLHSEDRYPDKHVINLDNLLGKNIHANRGEYKILVQTNE